MRRRPLLRAAAIGGGAYQAGRRRQDLRQREADERARVAALEELIRRPGGPAASR